MRPEALQDNGRVRTRGTTMHTRAIFSEPAHKLHNAMSSHCVQPMHDALTRLRLVRSPQQLPYERHHVPMAKLTHTSKHAHRHSYACARAHPQSRKAQQQVARLYNLPQNRSGLQINSQNCHGSLICLQLEHFLSGLVKSDILISI